MPEPVKIGSVVKGVFDDIQKRYENPKPVDSMESTTRPRLTGRGMLEYLHNEIRRRGIGRKREQVELRPERRRARKHGQLCPDPDGESERMDTKPQREGVRT